MVIVKRFISKYFVFSLAVIVLLALSGCTKTEVKEIIVKEKIAFEKINEDEPTLSKGVEEIKVKGEKGQSKVTYEVTYVNGKEESRKKLKEKVTKKPTDQIILIGTLTTETVEAEIPFTNKTVYSSSMAKGTSSISQQGVAGKKQLIYRCGYKDGVKVSETLVSELVVVAETPRITTIGTYVAPVTTIETPLLPNERGVRQRTY